MRNLLQYPVDRHEIATFLRNCRVAADPQKTGAVGDMSPILLDHVIAIVEAAFDLADGFDRRGREPGMGFVIPFSEATKLLQATALRSA